MLGYATIGSNDLPKAKAFYTALLAEMGAKVLMDVGRAAFFGIDLSKPMLGICTPYNQEAAQPGNGNMVALPGGSRAGVDKLYAKAISLGATDEGAPGERMPGFYGAYFRDLDGNKLAFFHMG
ncbi:MAG: VOC family protein [Pseudomonas sp.]|uniref:VOC family protein n=1 Tax=Pseudomonas sp. TaxID=306 RepID=UPI003BB55701